MNKDADLGPSHEDLLNENVGAVIQNPLAHLNQEQLLNDVESFANRMGLTDILPGLRRAAQVAQNAMVYDEVSRGTRSSDHLPVKLDEDEMLALKNEKDQLFAQSSGLYMTVLTVSFAAILQGWVQSSINGATLLFPRHYGLNDKIIHDQWIIGITNAAPFLFATVLGCPLVDPVNRLMGRRGAIMAAAVLIFASSLGSAFATDWKQLFACRIFNGIGMGLKAASTPILASETAVSFWRGSAALCWQLWVAFGMALGFAANLIVNTVNTGTYDSDTEKLSMQLQLGAPIVPSLVLLISIWWCPESPRWHMIKGDAHSYRKAYNIFLALRNTPIQAQRDLYLIHKQIELEAYTRRKYDTEVGKSHGGNQGTQVKNSNYLKRFAQLLSPGKPRLRSALLAACIVNLAQQLCGINVLAFYSSTLFNGVNASEQDDRTTEEKENAIPDEVKTAFLYSFGFGLINFVFCIPAIRNIDTVGRRALLLWTLPFMSISLYAAAGCFAIEDNMTAHNGLIAFFLFVFAALYSPGMGPMPFTVASESFPLSHREVGVAVSVGLNFFFAGLLTLFYPRILHALHNGGSLSLFASFNILSAVLIFLFLPETKQRSLEELDLVFAVPIMKFVKYELLEVLPYGVQRYVFRRDVVLRDLYEDKIWGATAWGQGNEGQELQELEKPETRELKKEETRTGQRQDVHGGWGSPPPREEIRELAPDQRDDGDRVERGRHGGLGGNDAWSISSSVGTHE